MTLAMQTARSRLNVGDLVRFVPIETGVDLITADGTKRVDPISRLERDVYRTTLEDNGIVVGGPYPFGSLVMWKVLVGAGEWFFESEHLVAVESHST